MSDEGWDKIEELSKGRLRTECRVVAQTLLARGHYQQPVDQENWRTCEWVPMPELNAEWIQVDSVRAALAATDGCYEVSDGSASATTPAEAVRLALLDCGLHSDDDAEASCLWGDVEAICSALSIPEEVRRG